MNHTDIKTEGWVAKLPEQMRPFAVLIRLDRPIGWWLLFLPASWGIMMAANGMQTMMMADWIKMTLFLIGAILMRGAGCVVNDIWDRNLDKQVERTQDRPLASGQVNLRQALLFLVGLCGVSFIILMMMPPVTIILGFISVLFIVTYPLMKRITWWPQLFLGVTFNFGALMGYSAVTGHLGVEVFLLYAASIFWTLGYDTIYAVQDTADDAVIGIKSTARLFGEQTQIWVAGFYSATIMLIAVCLYLYDATGVAYVVLVLPMAHFMWQVTTLKLDRPQNALTRFKSNRDVGFLIFAVMACIAL